ncbi:MAG: hypothetical protein WA766_17675 [Candidatus Acidiferrales bacterium]
MEAMKWIPFVERFEDMSPLGMLRVQRQQDGDVIVTVVAGDHHGNIESVSTVEFCTPMTGGGQSEKTWEALIALAEAMDEDNKAYKQNRRTETAK